MNHLWSIITEKIFASFGWRYMNTVAWKTFAPSRHPKVAPKDSALTWEAQPSVGQSRYLASLTDADDDSLNSPKLQSHSIAADMHDEPEFLKRIPVKNGDKVLLLHLKDVVWIQSRGNWICLNARNATYDRRMTMIDLQRRLDPRSFVRVHRNAIVNLDHVTEFTLPRTGDAFVHFNNGKALPISRAGRSVLRQYLRLSCT